jgi:hypothetical protein
MPCFSLFCCSAIVAMPASLISRIAIFTLFDDSFASIFFPAISTFGFRFFIGAISVSLRFQSQLIITPPFLHAIRHSFHAAMPLPPPAACHAFFIRFAATRRCRQPCLPLLMPLRFCHIFAARRHAAHFTLPRCRRRRYACRHFADTPFSLISVDFH